MEITKTELKTFYTTNNIVLLKPILDTSKTQGRPVELIVDTTYKPEHHSKVLCEVIAVPKQLIFSKKHPEYSMEWKCDMDLKVGDKVIINYLGGIMAEKHNFLTCEGEKFFLVPYERIYLVLEDKPRMLNGYILVEKIKIDTRKISKDIILIPGFEKRLGIVRFLHKPNEEYMCEEEDGDLINEGDIVVLSFEHYKALENSLHKVFDKNKDYLVMQRKHVSAVIKYLKL